MITPKFTPGPWSVTSCVHPGRVEYTVSGSGWVIARLTNGEHNANLVASAPALYAALHECFTEPFAHCLVNEDKDALYRRICAINDTVRAALALARGEKGGEVK